MQQHVHQQEDDVHGRERGEHARPIVDEQHPDANQAASPGAVDKEMNIGSPTVRADRRSDTASQYIRSGRSCEALKSEEEIARTASHASKMTANRSRDLRVSGRPL